MHIHGLERRQQPPPAGGGPQDGTNGGLPSYLWALVVVFIVFSIACGICARRTRRRQNLYRQAMLHSHRPTGSDRNPYAPPWTSFSRASVDTSGPQRPPRARRRGSQASVTSLPVYMENPGAQEVVLLQRAIPKEGDDTAPPTTQSTTGANLHANRDITLLQSISVPSAPTSQPAPVTVTLNSTPPLPSAVPSPPAPSLPDSHSPTPPLSDTRPAP